MQTSELVDDSQDQRNADERLLDYNKYADQFDTMCELVPAYKDNIDLLAQYLPSFELGRTPKILDLGAGTGNFVVALSGLLEEATFTHLDFDPAMNRCAREKYKKNSLHRVSFVEQHMQRANFPAGSFDLIVCVNSLNTAPPQLPMLQKMNSWLSNTGHLFLIDFGRKQRVLDWTWYVAKHTFKTRGFVRLIGAFWEHREAMKQNGNARIDQEAGRMWLHSTEELKDAVENAGFLVEHAQMCYRGYSDLVIAKKQE